MSADTENVDREPSVAGGVGRAPRAIQTRSTNILVVHVGGARRLKSCPANKGLRSPVAPGCSGGMLVRLGQRFIE